MTTSIFRILHDSGYARALWIPTIPETVLGRREGCAS